MNMVDKYVDGDLSADEILYPPRYKSKNLIMIDPLYLPRKIPM